MRHDTFALVLWGLALALGGCVRAGFGAQAGREGAPADGGLSNARETGLSDGRAPRLDSSAFPVDSDGPTDPRDRGPSFDLPPGISCDGVTRYDALGEGSPASPYILCHRDQLADLARCGTGCSASFRLARDLELGGSFQFPPNFSGELDGQGHGLFGLRNARHQPGDEVFPSVAPGGVVRDLSLLAIDLTTRGDGPLGTLVGTLSGSLMNVVVTGSIKIDNGDYGIGGVVGLAEEGSRIVGVEVDLTMTSPGGYDYYDCGGIVATALGGLMQRSSVRGSLSPAEPYGTYENGGLVGEIAQNARYRLEDCYSAVDISDTDGYTNGGLVGFLESGAVLELRRVHYAGMISAGSGHAIVGDGNGSVVLDGVYWHAEGGGGTPYPGSVSVSGQARSLDTAQMKRQESFVGFDFEGTWVLDPGSDYPRLR